MPVHNTVMNAFKQKAYPTDSIAELKSHPDGVSGFLIYNPCFSFLEKSPERFFHQPSHFKQGIQKVAMLLLKEGRVSPLNLSCSAWQQQR
jgi:hypothetical protein